MDGVRDNQDRVRPIRMDGVRDNQDGVRDNKNGQRDKSELFVTLFSTI